MTTLSIIDPPYLDHPYSITVAEINAWIAKLERMPQDDKGVQYALRSAQQFRKQQGAARGSRQTARRRGSAK